MTKYIALMVSFFSIYLAVELADILMITFSLIGYFTIIFGFIADSVTNKRKNRIELEDA